MNEILLNLLTSTDRLPFRIRSVLRTLLPQVLMPQVYWA